MTLIFYFIALASFILSVALHNAALQQDEEPLDHAARMFFAIGILLLVVFTFLAIFRG